MTEVDRRLVSALHRQLALRPARAARIGWKVGAGERERIGGEIAVGHLTSATLLEAGSAYRDGGGDLHADAEVALKLGDEQAIVGYGVALEIVDLAGDEGPEAVVAANVFHRAVAFGPMRDARPVRIDAAVVVNGEVRAAAPVDDNFAETVGAVARLLGSVGEQLATGDRIITGSVVQVPISAGDDVLADMGELGSVQVTIA